MSACSGSEEETWRRYLRSRINSETQDLVEGRSTTQDLFSSLALDIKSIGPVFGQAESVVRRMSVHRAATLGPKTNLSQVIIKNTQAQKASDSPQAITNLSVTRSQSHLTSNHVPTLAPRRAERIRLETALEEVWTKDILPFPGMASRRVENPIRASANSVMRKLSMASIASNFSRRSPSFTSLSHARSEESFSRTRKLSQSNLRAGPVPALVDFHNAPAAFLPTDFELQDGRSGGRRRRFADRAGGNDRSSSERSAIKKARRLSTHIVSQSQLRLAENRTCSRGSNATVVRNLDPRQDIPGSKETHKSKAPTPAQSVRVSSSASSAALRKPQKSKSRLFRFWM